MRKLIILSALLALTVGCENANAADSRKVQVQVTVIRATPFDCEGKWLCGCIGSENVRTTIKTPDGRIDHLCGYYGEVGDTITGKWVSGYSNTDMNGFRP